MSMNPGFGIIKNMSKEELIEELVHVYKKILEEQDMNTLRGNVVSFRMNQIRKSLIEESGLEVRADESPWGQL